MNPDEIIQINDSKFNILDKVIIKTVEKSRSNLMFGFCDEEKNNIIVKELPKFLSQDFTTQKRNFKEFGFGAD